MARMSRSHRDAEDKTAAAMRKKAMKEDRAWLASQASGSLHVPSSGASGGFDTAIRGARAARAKAALRTPETKGKPPASKKATSVAGKATSSVKPKQAKSVVQSRSEAQATRDAASKALKRPNVKSVTTARDSQGRVAYTVESYNPKTGPSASQKARNAVTMRGTKPSVATGTKRQRVKGTPAQEAARGLRNAGQQSTPKSPGKKRNLVMSERQIKRRAERAAMRRAGGK